MFELDRLLVGYDGPDLVAESGAWTFDVTVPGGAFVPAAGITFVAVSASHRRRGLLRLMMGELLDDAVERQEPLAVLSASESSIYERFGFGLGTYRTKLVVEPHRVRFRTSSAPTASCASPTPSRPARRCPRSTTACAGSVRARCRATTGGGTSCSGTRPGTRQGGTAMQYAVHPDGYVSYRVANEQTGGFPANRVMIRELVAVTPDGARVAVAGAARPGSRRQRDVHPLLARRPAAVARRRPRARSRRRASWDDTWVRLLARAAAPWRARRYLTEDRFVLELVDAFCPAIGGRFELDGGPDGAACRRTTAEPDLVMDIARPRVAVPRRRAGRPTLAAGRADRGAHAGRAAARRRLLRLRPAAPQPDAVLSRRRATAPRRALAPLAPRGSDRARHKRPALRRQRSITRPRCGAAGGP